MRPHPPDPRRVLSPPQVLAAGAGDTFRAVIPLCTLGAGRWGEAAGASEVTSPSRCLINSPPAPPSAAPKGSDTMGGGHGGQGGKKNQKGAERRQPLSWALNFLPGRKFTSSLTAPPPTSKVRLLTLDKEGKVQVPSVARSPERLTPALFLRAPGGADVSPSSPQAEVG